jgi:branched-chain amino acid transport system substrate-binding protein
MKRLLVASLVALLASGAAAENVKVGALYPLSGNAASAGGQTKAAIELAVEIINGQHPDVKGMPGTGLPGLKGGKIEVTFADHQGNPSTGQSQALRLIQQDRTRNRTR